MSKRTPPIAKTQYGPDAALPSVPDPKTVTTSKLQTTSTTGYPAASQKPNARTNPSVPKTNDSKTPKPSLYQRMTKKPASSSSYMTAYSSPPKINSAKPTPFTLAPGSVPDIVIPSSDTSRNLGHISQPATFAPTKVASIGVSGYGTNNKTSKTQSYYSPSVKGVSVPSSFY